MHFFNRRMDSKDDKNELIEKKVLTLNLTQFYQLWSTLYDLFDNEEFRLGQIIKKFGLNLLEIAETAAKEINFETELRNPNDLPVIKNQPKPDLNIKTELISHDNTDQTQSNLNLDATSTDSFEIVNNNEQYKSNANQNLINELDVQHAILITYPHFKASLLIEEQLSNFFEKTYEFDELFIKFRNNLHERTTSFSSRD